MKILEAFQGTDVSRADALEGLKFYGSAARAIDGEDSNDAVHMLFPEKLEAAAHEFLTGFRGASLYAVKANPHPAVLKLLWRAGVRRFDVASLREVELVSDLLPGAELYFMHPVKSRQAIRFAYGRGVRAFSFDSMDELNKIEAETGGASDISLFLRLQVEGGGAAYALGGKFGATLMEAPLLLSRARRMAQKIGVCFHVGSQCMQPGAYREALVKVSAMLQGAGISLDVIDVGGGFPVPYPGMEPPAMQVYFDAIHTALDDCGFADTETLCEPGRALVAKAGAVAVRVEMRRGDDLYLNDGTYGALFDAGVPGWQFPMAVHTADGRKLALGQTGFRFFGPTCDSCDKMEGPFFLPDDIEEGDWIVIQHLGAYGFTMQTRFNGFYSEDLVAVEDIAASNGTVMFPVPIAV
ncbi:type III PLP-dependent enzyme [Kordiimonas marina]|uniref:type III PLP-dependent enzyme n=1 Tax=Kordiimonas marina TaxID=2872312 RepID=UPI001FF2F4C5|nr:type III PLP-dependent enzyme [Kordiimonas marina]MCJ9430539.1 type III PLP-dependent enzyme [Kordiimonas marina]